MASMSQALASVVIAAGLSGSLPAAENSRTAGQESNKATPAEVMAQRKLDLNFATSISTLIKAGKADSALALLGDKETNQNTLKVIEQALKPEHKEALLKVDTKKAESLVFSPDSLKNASEIKTLIEAALKADPKEIDPNFFANLVKSAGKYKDEIGILLTFGSNSITNGSNSALAQVFSRIPADSANYREITQQFLQASHSLGLPR